VERNPRAPHGHRALPTLQLGSRFGRPGGIVKRFVARLVRFLIVYQMDVNERLLGYVSELAMRSDETEKSVADLQSLATDVAALGQSIKEVRAAVATLASSIPQQITKIQIDGESVNRQVSTLQAFCDEIQVKVDRLQSLNSSSSYSSNGNGATHHVPESNGSQVTLHEDRHEVEPRRRRGFGAFLAALLRTQPRRI
jgi:prefoldin subunit 5